jgi:hypothetical protein
MSEWEEEIDKNTKTKDIEKKLIKVIFDNCFKMGVCMDLTDLDLQETDYSRLTVKEVMDKIRDFLAQKPKDISEMTFLRYLAKYPVTMCKREVSPRLKTLIGFHYRLGVPNQQQADNGAEKVSYDDLAEIFVRSKATISECVNQTENEWKDVQYKVQQEQKLEEEAHKQLLEEKMQELRKVEQNNQTVSQTTERTPNSPSEEV